MYICQCHNKSCRLFIRYSFFLSLHSVSLSFCLLQNAGRRGIQFYSIAKRGSVQHPSNDHTWADVVLQPFLQNRDLSPYLQQRLCLPQSLVSLR